MRKEYINLDLENLQLAKTLQANQNTKKIKINMNREETKAAAEVMMAFAEGKTVEVSWDKGENWHEVNPCQGGCSWNWQDANYRIKPESKYRPFANAEEVMAAIKEHGCFIVRNCDGRYIIIRAFDSEFVCVGGGAIGHTLLHMMNNYTFADGTPFGKLEE